MTDLVPMDLSKLLGDLYETDETGSPPDPVSAEPSSPAPVPERANEARLDEAFASWKPGPPDDAPAAEREVGDGYQGDSYQGHGYPGHGYPGDDYQATSFPQLEAALSGDTRVDDDVQDDHVQDDDVQDDRVQGPVADGDPSMVDGVLVESAQADVADGMDGDGDTLAGPPRMWTRADDDVLPHSRGGRRGGRLRLRRR